MSLFHINSFYRNSGTFDNFTIQIPTGVCFNRVKLLDASIPQTMYVFNSNNNILSFQEATGGITQAVIPIGNYIPSSLISAIASALTAASASSQPYTVTYNSVTACIT